MYAVLLSACASTIQKTVGMKCEGNCINGKGTWIFPNGDKYIGEFKNRKCFVKGNWIFSNRDNYFGEQKNCLPNRKGTLTLANGDKKVEEWKKGKFVK